MKITLYFLLLTSWACQPPGKSNATHNPRDHKHEAKGYVLQKYEGEVLNDPRGRKMIIKVSPQRGAAHLTMGTTGMPKGTGIFVDRHEHADEILFVYRGNGFYRRYCHGFFTAQTKRGIMEPAINKSTKTKCWLFFWGVLDYAVTGDKLGFELWNVSTQLSFTLLLAFLIFRFKIV